MVYFVDVACEKEYSLLFTEMDIVSEEEPKLAPESSSEKKDDDKLKEYETFLKSEQSSTMLKGNFTDTELTDMAGKETENDKQLIKFKNRISVEPDQVYKQILIVVCLFCFWYKFVKCLQGSFM